MSPCPSPPASTALLLVAAGRGLRAGGDVPKQWRDLDGQTVADRTLAAFAGIGGIGPRVAVLHRDDIAARVWAPSGVEIVAGGPTRAASVRAGLAALRGRADRVLIHDIARPFVTAEMIGRVLAALDHAPAAAPGLPVTDALWRGAPDGAQPDGPARVTGLQDRAGLFRAQTPQGFHLPAILAAHSAARDDAADDVAVARAAGLDVAIVPGDEDNFKITAPGDFARAARILSTRRHGGGMDVRTGNGFDVHRFGPGDHVMLCGVRVAHDRGLQGHSDADVGLHALADAIYGALAAGDIGRHFPPTDAAWKDADSAQFLAHAAGLARVRGFGLTHLDLTLVCETPKIAPHADAMRHRVAGIVDIAPDRVSVKATTSERLGFTGRGEGIAGLATATLVAP